MFHILSQFGAAFLTGLLQTLRIALMVWGIGLVAGCFGAYAVHCGLQTYRSILQSLVFFTSNIPVIILLMWSYYPLQRIIGVSVSGTTTTICVLAILNSLSVANLTLKALDKFPHELENAARSLGIPPRDLFISIKLPIMLEHLLPALIGLQLSMLHMTLFGSLLSVDELFRTSQRIIAQTYQPIQVYSALAVFFLLVGAAVHLFLEWWKRRNLLTRSGEEICS